jgi:hypothetical protein
VRRVRAGAGNGKIDPAQGKLFDVLRVIAELAAAIDLHLVATARVLLHLLRKDHGSRLACPLLLIGVTEFQHRLGTDTAYSKRKNHERKKKNPDQRQFLIHISLLFYLWQLKPALALRQI